MDLNAEKDPDLMWIPYLYCIFLIRYSNNNNNILEKLLKSFQKSKKNNVALIYDSFFKLLL